MARRKHPAFRELDGILLLDKPRGISSNQALQQARRLFAAEKGGHTGSLDPLATGLLPLCFGEATKLAGLLLSERKAYETVARFGIETDTADADGTVVATAPVPPLDEAVLRAALGAFIGRIRQVPPVYSALKQDGEPLYAKARRGETVEVPSREVDVHAIEVLDCRDDQAQLRIECGSGTYVRSLVRDLGRALGCGAHVAELRRLWIEPFVAPRMHTLEELQQVVAAGGREALDALLLPLEAGMAHLPALVLDATQALKLGQGQSLPWTTAEAGDYAAFDASGRALGLVQIDADGVLRARRLLRHLALQASQASGGAGSR